MINDLEFVCGGNNGRGPIAEAVARHYCQTKRIRGIRISSSGTKVDFLKTATREQVAQAIKQYVPLILNKGFITPEQAKELEEGKNVLEILSPLLNALSRKESNRRDIILNEMGLLEYLPLNRSPNQTKVRLEAELILPLGQDNYQRVLRIYSGLTPIIECLGDFEDTFFMDTSTHKQVANQIRKATIEAMEKYLI